MNSDSSQRSAALDVLQRMKVYGGQQEKELSCEEIAMMLDYAQKTDGKPLGIETSILRIVALRIRGDICADSFKRLGTASYIDRAIDYHRWAMLLTPNWSTNKPKRLMGLGISYFERFESLGKISDIHKAIAYQTQAVGLIPASHASKPAYLSNLGVAYSRRFEQLGRLIDVKRAITCHARAINLTPEGDPKRPRQLNNLGGSYQARFERLQELSDVDEAVSCFTRAVELTQDDDLDKPDWLTNLGRSHLKRFKRLGKLSDFDKAMTCQTQAVELTPTGHTGKPSRLNALGRLYQSRFDRLGEAMDIQNAIVLHTQAVELAPEGHAGLPGWLSGLGSAYLARNETLGAIADVEKAIAYYTQAVALTPDRHENKHAWLTNLGSSYMRRFEQLGELSDVDKAIAYGTQAVELIPEGDARMPVLLNNLGISCMRRFEHLGERSDIMKAIACHTKALESTGDGDAHGPVWFSNLGTSYYARFRSFGELADIDKAVACHSQAVKLTPKGHADRPGRLGNLGRSYDSRFERLGELSDLDEAITCQTQAVEMTPDGYISKPGWLTNLGNSFIARFKCSSELSDVEKAIACHTRAVELTPEGHPEKPARINNVGNSYQSRFERCGELSDNEKSIAYRAQAVELTPDGHVDKPTWIQNLGTAYEDRFERLGELSDLENAIAYLSQAVKLTPKGHTNKPWWLINLGRSYLTRFKRCREHSDLELASKVLQLAAQPPICKPDAQFHSACLWARCSSWLGVSPKLAYQTAMELVPQLVWLGATIERRYDLLVEIGDIAIEAAAWAISVKAYDLALEWLEEGRSIVWNQILQLRATYDDLAAVDPALAQSLERTAHELEHAGSRSTLPPPSANAASDLEQGAQRHRQLAAEWEQMLAKARSIDGFHNLMRPRKVNELRLAAKSGPIVLINVHSSRCDALVLQQSNASIAHIPLPDFSSDRAVGTSAKLASLLGRQGTRSRGFKPAPYQVELRRILAMLWSGVVKPILDFLGYTRKLPIEELPHITWCTTGELSFLPLHAAGCYDGVQPNAPDLVVSSFTPTLGALLLPTAQAPGSHSGLLVVGQQFSKKHGDLPNVVEELEAINKHANAACFKELEGNAATVEAVLNTMDEYSSVHLACHASQNSDNPALSAFHLHDGDLTLEAITKRSFKNKGLAFLSACQTATGDKKRPDESIHLAAGMMMAGYPSVIATMWSIYDVDGPEVAGQVYAELLKDGEMDWVGAARALHKAVAGLREKVGEDSFKRWVPFVHIGVSA